jgi:hypothetical protein
MRNAKFVLAIALTVSPVSALAYFDPGTGSLLIQGLIGALAAVAMFWSNLKIRLRSMFSKDKSKPSSTELDEGDSPRDTTKTD